MIRQAALEPGLRVLEIGSGGYNAALLREVVGDNGQVVTIDIDPAVTDRATRTPNRGRLPRHRGNQRRRRIPTNPGEDIRRDHRDRRRVGHPAGLVLPTRARRPPGRPAPHPRHNPLLGPGAPERRPSQRRPADVRLRAHAGRRRVPPGLRPAAPRRHGQPLAGRRRRHRPGGADRRPQPAPRRGLVRRHHRPHGALRRPGPMASDHNPGLLSNDGAPASYRRRHRLPLVAARHPRNSRRPQPRLPRQAPPRGRPGKTPRVRSRRPTAPTQPTSPGRWPTTSRRGTRQAARPRT